MNESDIQPQITRRQALKTTAFAAGIGAALAAIRTEAGVAAEADRPTLTASGPELRKNDVVLFQGDSITDAGRDRGAEGHANHTRGLGYGYALHAAGGLRADHGPLDLRVFNRGISGNKVPDLDARWQADCMELNPAVLSILIGVNDIWHKLNGNYDGTVDDYRAGFAALLDRTREALPDTRIVVCEPFVLRCGAVNDRWFPEFDERRGAAAEVAKLAGTVWVPFQSMFDAAVEAGTEPAYWAGDGVHPTLAGHSLMATTWREVTGL